MIIKSKIVLCAWNKHLNMEMRNMLRLSDRNGKIPKTPPFNENSNYLYGESDVIFLTLRELNVLFSLDKLS